MIWVFKYVSLFSASWLHKSRLSSDAIPFFKSPVALQTCCNIYVRSYAAHNSLFCPSVFLHNCEILYTAHRKTLACLDSNTFVLTLLHSWLAKWKMTPRQTEDNTDT